MNTRRVEDGQRRRQNGWASASEYDVLRGLNGTAVAFKAALQDGAEKRELLYALQAFSLRDGGVKRIARELLEMCPERIGTPTMHKIGCKAGKRLTDDQSDAISGELFNDHAERALRAAIRHEAEAKDIRTAEEWIEVCRDQAESSMADFIEELCCDPKMEVAAQSEAARSYRKVVNIVLDDARDLMESNPRMAKDRPDLESTLNKARDFRFAELPYFHDVLGALQEYVRRHSEQVRRNHVETSIGKIVFEALDYVVATGRSALVEGNSGFGKTTAAKAWCEMHPGQARYVQLSGITARTVFFRKLAKALGVASGGGMSSGKVQARVEDFLQRTKLMLVIDEGQYLWPQGKRIVAHPELINWLNTACYNEGVPFLISATKQFTLRRQVIERQTDWSSEQSRRRIRKVFPLPDAPTTADLRSVARKLLGALGIVGETAVEFVVGYAMASRGYFQTITDAIEDAELIARRAGRDRITAKDLQTAVKEWRAPSDAALQRVFDSKPVNTRHGSRVTATEEFEPAEPPLNEPLNRHLGRAQDAFSGVAVRRETQPTAAPALVPG